MKLDEKKDALVRLKELRYEIENALYEAGDILRSTGKKSEDLPWLDLVDDMLNTQYEMLAGKSVKVQSLATVIDDLEKEIKLIESDRPRTE